jgi:hypothetical protein
LGCAGLQPKYDPLSMPTVLRVGPLRFFFYSNEAGEPPHVHVQRDLALAKFWLAPVALASSTRFGGHELRRIERIVNERAEQLREAWNDFFQTQA